MARSTVEIVNEIKKNLSQRSSSQRDEVAVMHAMINDKDYVVDVYATTGKVGTYCPSEDARKLTASLIASTTKISKDESEHLANEHEFSKAEAASFIGIGKEFINTYIETGRKLPLGQREKSNVSLIGKDAPVTITRYPKKVIDNKGNVSYESAKKQVPAHKAIRAISPCPKYVH